MVESNREEEKKQELKQKIEAVEEELKQGAGETDPVQYLMQQLEKFNLTAHQTREVKRQLESGEGEVKDRIKNALGQLKDTATNLNRGTIRKLDNITPLYDDHGFWDTQPVPKAYENVSPEQFDAAIDREKTVDEIDPEPYKLPPGYVWSDVDVNDPEQAEEVYTLLTKHYVEDDDAMFRFDYQIPFLQWALTPPGYIKEWQFGVRGGKKNQLFGFITGIPVDMVVRGKTVKMAEINFLCVHKKLRTKKLAPVLIQEVTRRVNRLNIWQAVYTAGIVIPVPFAKTTYWHRNLNPKKLIDVGFSSLPQNTTMARYQKLLKLPDNPTIAGVRPMAEKDMKTVHAMLTEYLAQFDTHFHFSPEELKHFILPRDNVIEAFVIEEQGKITDFFSFYSLPSSILKHVEEKTLHVAYSYYTVAKKHSVQEVFKQALIMAKKKGYDVFNALDIMENKKVFEDHKFGVGDGNLHYYFYNWRVRDVEPEGVSMVLV